MRRIVLASIYTQWHDRHLEYWLMPMPMLHIRYALHTYCIRHTESINTYHARLLARSLYTKHQSKTSLSIHTHTQHCVNLPTNSYAFDANKVIRDTRTLHTQTVRAHRIRLIFISTASTMWVKLFSEPKLIKQVMVCWFSLHFIKSNTNLWYCWIENVYLRC